MWVIGPPRSSGHAHPATVGVVTTARVSWPGMTTAMTTTTRHPLAPLDGDEINAAREIVLESGRVTIPADEVRFAYLGLCDPPKALVHAHDSGGTVVLDRRVSAVLLQGPEATVVEVIVSVTRGVVDSWIEVADVRPNLQFEEAMEVIGALRADPEWNAALDRRGIVDKSLVQIDPWPAGTFGSHHEKNRRITKALAYLRDSPDDNGYARPARGVAGLCGHGPGHRARGRRHRRRAVPPAGRELLPRGQRAAAHRSAPAGHHAERGPELHRRREPGALAEVVAAGRHGPARRLGHPHRRLRGRGTGAPTAVPGLGQRDGRPLRRSRTDALVEERIRRRRMGTRSHGQLADTGLRLPRRDHLPRRCVLRRTRSPAHPSQRHLPPRRGLRDPLEAPRHDVGPHRGAPLTPPRRELDRHRRQLRIRLLLVLLSRRHYAIRGEADRNHVDHGCGRWRR